MHEAVQKDWIAMLSVAKHVIFREIRQILQSLRSFRMAFTFFLDRLKANTAPDPSPQQLFLENLQP